MGESSKNLEAKRGGYAVAFIYVPLILTFGAIGHLLNIPANYLYMVVAIVAVMGGYYLQGYIFKQPVIVASNEGIWTRALGQIPWGSVKDIRLEKTRRFTTKGLGKIDTELIIETVDGRESNFDGDFLNVGVENFHTGLHKFWNAQKNAE